MIFVAAPTNDTNVVSQDTKASNWYKISIQQKQKQTNPTLGFAKPATSLIWHIEKQKRQWKRQHNDKSQKID